MSTEDLIETRYLTLSSPLSEMERCASPCSSIKAIHTISRPNSYNPFEAPFNYAALADLASIQTPGDNATVTTIAGHVVAVENVHLVSRDVKHGDAESIMTYGSRRSNATSQTTRSRAVRRSNMVQNLPVVDDIGEDYAEEDDKEKAVEAKRKKTWATSSKRWKRAMSQLFTSAKENAGIIDRLAPTLKNDSPVLSRFPTAPLATSSSPLITPTATLSKHGHSRALSLFQLGRSRTISMKKTLASVEGNVLTTHWNVSTLTFVRSTTDDNAARKACNQRVRRSRSFSGFTGLDLGLPSDDDSHLDELDDVTREAAAISRSVGAEWGYVDEE